MGPIPEDLIVFLLFGLFVLIQILRARRRRKARRAEPAGTAPAEAEPAAAMPAPPPAWTPTLSEGPRPKPPTVMRPGTPVARPETRRFSRRRLLGDRRSLQDAIVIATVLGPCLAQRPRDTE